MAARPSHIHFFADLVKILNNNGNDLAVFFLRYTLTPHEKYPTQLRQAVECLRYILEDTSRSPADVILGGDSAGGNLALATLLHISHPHPDIKPLVLDTPLAGTFAFAPWVDFSTDWPSFVHNAYRDVCGAEKLKLWAGMYLGEREGDYWSEPSKAPVEWWADAKTERILVLVGSDEVLFSSIEAFTKKVKVCLPFVSVVVLAQMPVADVCRLSFLIPLLLLVRMRLTMRIFMLSLGLIPRRAVSCGSGFLLDCRYTLCRYSIFDVG